MAKIGALGAKKAKKANKAKKAEAQKQAQAQKQAKAEAKKKTEAKKQAKLEAARAQAQKQAKAQAQKQAKAEAKKKAQEIQERAAKNNSKVKVKAKGNQVIKTYPNGKKVVQTINKNGKVSQKEISTGKGENKVTTTIDYKAGEKVSKTVTSGRGDNKVVTELKYDDGKKVKKTVTTTRDNIPTVKTIEYNPQTSKPVVKFITIGEGDNAFTSKTEYKYGKNDNLKSKVVVKSDGSAKEYIYDNYKTQDGTKTRTVTLISKGPDGVERRYSEEQTVNKNGKVLEFVRKNEQGEVVLKGTNSYNENGTLSAKTTVKYNEDGSRERTQFSNYRKTDTVNQNKYDVKITTFSPEGAKDIYTGTETKSLNGDVKRRETEENKKADETKNNKTDKKDVKAAVEKAKSKIESELSGSGIELISGNIKTKVLSIIEQFKDFFGAETEIEKMQNEIMKDVFAVKDKFEINF